MNDGIQFAAGKGGCHVGGREKSSDLGSAETGGVLGGSRTGGYADFLAAEISRRLEGRVVFHQQGQTPLGEIGICEMHRLPALGRYRQGGNGHIGVIFFQGLEDRRQGHGQVDCLQAGPGGQSVHEFNIKAGQIAVLLVGKGRRARFGGDADFGPQDDDPHGKCKHGNQQQGTGGDEILSLDLGHGQGPAAFPPLGVEKNGEPGQGNEDGGQTVKGR